MVGYLHSCPRCFRRRPDRPAAARSRALWAEGYAIRAASMDGKNLDLRRCIRLPPARRRMLSGMAADPQVLIVGAGPTGLVHALWLHRAGVRVRIVDKAPLPGTASRALAVH